MSDTLIIVQARMGGTRFPGKVLAPLLGQPMLLWQLDRLRQVPATDLVIAVPHGPDQQPIRDLCQKHGYRCFAAYENIREDDVLSRYAATVACYPEAQTVVRVTADCPLLDPQVVTTLLEYHNWHQVSPAQLRACVMVPYTHTGIAAEWPDGQDVEAFTRKSLLWASDFMTTPADREHVTPGIWKNKERFPQCATFPCPMNLSHYQYSVDTPQDLLLIAVILRWCLERYGFAFGWREIWWCLEVNPHLKQMMLQRPPRNQSYVTQVGASTWQEARYGQS